MNFSRKLNDYIELIGCSAKELSEISGISNAVLSRYRNNERIPKSDSKQFDLLVQGLSTLAIKNKVNLSHDTIKEELQKYVNYEEINFEAFRDNLNTVISKLNINVANMSRYIGFDSSYLSKIRSGSRKPQNINEFINSVCKYIIKNYNDSKSIEIIKSLIGDMNTNDYQKKLVTWISNHSTNNDSTINFLKKLDQFDLNEYIKAIKFDKLIVPTMPINLPKNKVYYGIEGYKESQLDTLKAIVFSKSKSDIFFYSNMSMIEASKDLNFTKKFMFNLALILKKGLHLKIIHNLDRPIDELMIGLEGWIPLYMTGQISPYYLTNNSNLYSTIDCSNDSICLHGSYITGNIKKSKFVVSNKKEDINYYIENNKLILKKANPLMNIYTSSEKFNNEINKYYSVLGNIRNINSKLPIYTISDDLLIKILENNNINEIDKEKIINFVEHEKVIFKSKIKSSTIIDEINIQNKEEFKEMTLSLSKMFYNKDIFYSYEDYLEHINLTKKLANKYKNYEVKINKTNIFKNINIQIISNKYVIISKDNTPNIHFIINHPILIEAINNFEVPIIEVI